jgi:3'(2'), 5'-bisphosphate nucleotidase
LARIIGTMLNGGDMSYQKETEVALEAVRSAARVCEAVRRIMVTGAVRAMEKSDQSPVTVADFASQAVVCRHLERALPGDVVLAEEDASELAQPERARELASVAEFAAGGVADVAGADLAHDPRRVLSWIDRGRTATPGSRGRFWTLDPIDGTKGFLRDDQYAVALALIEDGKVCVGVLACPRLDGGVIFVAARGAGARLATVEGGAPVAMASPQTAPRLVESVESRHGDHERQESIARAAGLDGAPLRMDSQAKYGVVARGDAALYLRLPSPATPDYREKIWDHAAGAYIITEAGGRVTDVGGRELRFDLGETLADNQGIVATRGIDHDGVLRALARARA